MNDHFSLQDSTLSSYMKLDVLLSEIASKADEAKNVLVELTLPVLAVESERQTEEEEDEDE